MTGYQIPRNSLAWMLAAQAAVIAPHVGRLHIWICAVCLGSAIWRIMVYQGRWSYPGRWVKMTFVFGGLIGIFLGYSKVYGLEPAIALLVIAFALKQLEMQHKRDAYIVILLAYFVAMTEFLFYQTIPYTIYVFISILMITSALIGLHQTQSHLSPIKTLRTALNLLVQSIPLMVILFVLFPRIPPLWTVPIPSDVGRTGVTDTMSPGDIALLTQSDGLAFKATFETTPPPSFSKLYWRGLVLSEFDGRTWSQDPLLSRSVWRYRQATPGWIRNVEYLGNEYQYDIILEPSQQNWLFSLAMAELPRDRDLVILHDYRIASRRPVRNRLRYELNSHLNFVLDRELSAFWRYRYTRLPPNSNPESQSLALNMMAASGSPRAFVDDVLRMYNLEEFVYTLKPPKLGRNSIDQFLLSTRRGFCEHYAGSFVFLMRAAGIPARVVVGYQGGEYNPRGNYVSVRQFDAHAWSEVWLEDRGWVRFDPTSAVAPDRIERGLEAAVEDENTFLSDSPLSIFRYRQLLWLTDLRLQMDAIGHYWDTWVVGYTPETQMSILRRYLGDVDQTRLGTILLSVFFSMLGVIAFFVLTKRSKTALRPIDSEYLKFCLLMEKRGYGRKIGEGPLDYARRLGRLYPELRHEVDTVTQAYVQNNYIDNKPTDVIKLKRAVRVMKFKTLATG